MRWFLDLASPTALLILAISNLFTVRDLVRLKKESLKHRAEIDDIAGLLLAYVPGVREEITKRSLGNG